MARNEAQQGTVAASAAALGLAGTAALAGAERAANAQAVQQAAYFSLFSIPNPASPSTGITLLPFVPQLAIGFIVNEGLHRFEVRESEPDPVCGFRASKAISQEYVARVHMKMIPMPNNFEAAADRVPPPTLLLPFLSQRFSALDGRLEFLDGAGSGFRAFGCGRTFPASINGATQIRLAGVLDIIEGFGRMAGLHGTGIVSGEIEPPSGFAFNTLFRLVNPSGSLQARAPIASLQSTEDPIPQTAFLPLLGEPDPAQPLTAELMPDGKHLRVRIAERLRLAVLNCDVNPPAGIRSQMTAGTVVGSHRASWMLDVSRTEPVIPAYSRGEEFRFFDREGQPIGGFRADMFEARVFSTPVAGLSSPIFRIGGFALPTTGTGQFSDPVGTVSVNGAFSPATGAASVMYMVRLSDPLGRFRPFAA